MTFPNAKVFHLTAISSNHSHILTNLHFQNGKRATDVLDEPTWFRQDGFPYFVKNTWRQNNTQKATLANTLKSLGSTLKDWNLNSIENVKHKITQLKRSGKS